MSGQWTWWSRRFSKLVTADTGDLVPLKVGSRRDTLPLRDDDVAAKLRIGGNAAY
jgi:hypothetical protein